MRIISYLFTLLLFSNSLYAQLVNADFENWNSVTSNKINTWIPQGNVSRVTGGQDGTYAIKLETDSLQGLASITLSTTFTNGYPYFNNVDTVKLWVKYAIANGDSATFQVLQFNSDTNLVRAGEYFITTGTASTWTEIAIPLAAFDTSYSPQTLYIYADNTSSSSPQLSSNLMIDNIRCYYNGVLQSNIPNYSFENWTAQTVNNVAGWTTSNELFAQIGIDSVNCEQSTPGQHGTYAVKLHTVDIFGTFIPGGIVTGINQVSAAQAPNTFPTFAVDQRYSSLSGYLKFNKKGTDSAEASVYMFYGGALVGTGRFLQASSVSAYTQFEAKIAYEPGFAGGVPDSATIVFLTASDPTNATGTSEMWIDNIQLNIFALGIDKPVAASYNIYPNPFNSEINIATSSEKAVAKIYSLEGKEMISQTMNKGNNTINTASIASGFYIIKIADGENIVSRKMIKE